MSKMFCPNSPNGRHNFAIANTDCVYGCGVNQMELSGRTRPIQQTSMFGQGVERFKNPKSQSKRIHSELHQLIADLIAEYNEPPKIKIGGREVATFGYYLGRLKKVPLQLIYQWRASVKQGRDIRNPSKVFWWFYAQWMKEMRER